MTDRLRLQCSGCQAVLQMKSEMRGKLVKCPKCGAQFRVPDVSAKESPEEEVGVFDSLPDLPSSGTPFPGATNDSSYWQNSSASYSSSKPMATAPSGPQKSYASSSSRTDDSEEEMGERDQHWQSSGIFLAVIPVLTAVLPLFGLQLRRLSRQEEFAPLLGMVMGLIGAGFIVYARRRRHDAFVAGGAAVLLSLVFGIGGYMLQKSNPSEPEGNAGRNRLKTPTSLRGPSR